MLNNRLVKFAEENNIYVDEQNGFRRGRSTVDHISTLTSIIEYRKLNRLSTYAAFIDFKKAYNSIDRFLLFSKLRDIGINGAMFQAVRFIYNNVQCCVRVN